MLFLNIYTWEPGQRTEILKRRAERGMSLSEGVKFVGEWSDVNGRRGFLLVEANDSKAIMASAMVWSHLMKMEIVPVIETADLWKGIEGKGAKK